MTESCPPEGASDPSLYTTHNKLKNKLAATPNQWEEATEALEKERL
jgi:hypothetical protein